MNPENEIRRVEVNASTSYSIYIGDGLLKEAGNLTKEIHKPCSVLIVSDSNVASLYQRTVVKAYRDAGFNPVTWSFPAGETSKNIDTLSDLLEFMAAINLNRSDLVVALGGGVTGDMTGLAAGLFKRGLDYIQIPTTVLSAVDSSVGGKTAINLKGGKNLAGLFKQPILVVSDTETLQTLSPFYLSDGYAECIKYGVLGNRKLLDIFENKDPSEHLPEIIEESVKMKAAYVEGDEFDRGIRCYLNLGHTLGHAIELCSGYTEGHGHAVATGMVLAAVAGERRGITEPGTATRLYNILERNGLLIQCPYGTAELIEGVLEDKKRKGDEIKWIVPETIDSCTAVNINISDLDEWISQAFAG